MFSSFLIAAGPIREGETRKIMAWCGGGNPGGSLFSGQKQEMSKHSQAILTPVTVSAPQGSSRGVLTLRRGVITLRQTLIKKRSGYRIRCRGPLFDDAGFRLRSYVKRIAPCSVELQISGLRKYIADGTGMPYATCPLHSVVCLVHGRKHQSNKRPQYVSVDLGCGKVSFRCFVMKKEGWRRYCDFPCPRFVSDGFSTLGWGP